MKNQSSKRRQRADKTATTAATSSTLITLPTSPTNDEKLSVAKRLDELKTSVKDQAHLLNKDKESSGINILIDKIIDHYSDIKTILTIPELLAPATKSRALGTPRPQNAYIIFRKDVSRGIYLLSRNGVIERKKNVTYSSKIAGYLWKSLKTSKTQHDHEFWKILYQIACLKHSATYENYVYRPIRKKRNDVNCQSIEHQQSPNVATLETSSNHPPPRTIPASDINDAPSYYDNSVDQGQTIDFHSSDQGMVINQLQAQQQEGNDQPDTLDPTLYQDMTTILPYQIPDVINQPPGMITQQNITTQFGFASATSTYVENTVWHSTYAMSSHLTQPYYQYFPNTYSTLPPQPILIYPSYDDLVFQSQLDQLDGSGSGFIEYGDQSQSFGM